MDDTIGIDIECDLDLRYSTRSRGNPFEIECPESPVLGSKLPFALKDMDGYCCLSISRCREDLALPCRNSGIPLNELRADAAECLNTKRKRCDIKEKKAS